MGVERRSGDESRSARGRDAEGWAAAWLEEQGYRLRERNFRTHVGEIDIVAIDEDCLCFIEVKARWSADYGPAILAVDSNKKSRICRSAALFLIDSPWQGPIRFDVLALDRRNESWEPTLIRNAFEVSSPFLV